MSTIDPFAARRLADQPAPGGIAMLAAPVSGATGRAASGELSIIVGGALETVAACKDLFEAMGKNVFHVGGLGQGLAMKLVNNMLIQVNTVAIAEALVMGVKAGLYPQRIYDVVRVSTGTSFAFETRVPRMLKRDFSPGGTVDISFKDQELETAFAKQLGVPVLLANVSQQVYQMARAAGFNKEDGSAVIKIFERLAGVRVGGGEGGDGHLRARPRSVSGRLDMEAGGAAPAGRRPRGLRAHARRLRRAARSGPPRNHRGHACPGDRAAPLLRRPVRRRAGGHQLGRHGGLSRRRAGRRA